MTYEVFGVKEDDENRYALEMSPWEEWLHYDVLKKSIEFYGEAQVVAHALYEMTFFGYSAEAVAKRVDEEKQILNERLQEVGDGSVEFLTFEELKAELGIVENHTPEEKEQKTREIERITRENELVYQSLLGYMVE